MENTQHMILHKDYLLIPIPCPTRCCIWSCFPIYESPSHRNDLVVSLKAVLYHSRLSCSPNCNIHLTHCRFLLQAKCTILDGSLIKVSETSIWLNKNHVYSPYLKMTPVKCSALLWHWEGGWREGRGRGTCLHPGAQRVRRQSSRPAKESSNTLGLPWVFEEVVSP